MSIFFSSVVVAGFCFFDSSVVFYFLVFLMPYLFLGFGKGAVISQVLFMDGLGFVLIVLSAWVFFLCVVGGFLEGFSKESFGFFLSFIGFVFSFLVLSFSFSGVLLFYFSFEFIFILLYVLIMGWGYSPERLRASFYMLFYTLIVSFPFFMLLVWSYSFGGASFFNPLGIGSGVWWGFFILVFLVKLPVFGVHLWLPKAHVEAPLAGSMVLAGVLLKIGGYGILRFSGSFLSSMKYFSSFIFGVGLVGAFFVCFLCLRQSDMKALVAYSSVSHMGMALFGVVSSYFVGSVGGVFMLVAHGICSSALFSMLYLSYVRVHSRSIALIKGGLIVYPLLGLWWFMFSICNIGVPPSLGFFSEVFIVVGGSGFDLLVLVFIFPILFFSGVYSIFLYVSAMHGEGFFSSSVSPLDLRELSFMFFHLFPLFLIPFFPLWFF